MSNKPTHIIITGASRGIGRALAIELAASVHFGHSHFFITSTDASDLEATKKTMLEVVSPENLSKIKVDLFPMDFGDLEHFEDNLGHFKQTGTNFRHVILIMNHGTIGPLELLSDPVVPISEYMSHNTNHLGTGGLQIRKHVDINITSCIGLCRFIIKRFLGNAEELDIVNISSIVAKAPVEAWSTYCIGKAARDMLMKVIELESGTKSGSSITRTRSLNYAPGIVDTDMQEQVRAKSPIAEQKSLYTRLYNRGILLKPQETSRKLVSILKTGWKSGAHIDYSECDTTST